MSRTVRRHRLWLIPLCFAIAAIASACCWQQLQAQGPGIPPMADAPGISGEFGYDDPMAADTTGMTHTAAAPVNAVSLESVVSSGVATISDRNWDGTTTQLMRFKYTTMDDKTITVHLPSTYKDQMKSRAGWDTLFRVFAMDREAQLAIEERNRPADVSAFMNEFMAEVTGEVPEGTFFGVGHEAALDHARSALPAMGMQLPPMPVPMMGMP